MSGKVTAKIAPKQTVTGQLARAETVGGTKDYNKLDNKPSINTVTLISDKSFEDLGLVPITNEQLENIFRNS